MPSLKQLTCSIELSNSKIPFQEYGISYQDAMVRSYIAVPHMPTSFSIHLKSNGFIDSGLAMFVFADGLYQCNRNQLGLAPLDDGRPRNCTEIDFRVRQKEIHRSGEDWIGRPWRFEPLKLVDDLECSPDHFKYLGTIQIFVLRCESSGTRRRLPFESLNSPERTRSGLPLQQILYLEKDHKGHPEKGGTNNQRIWSSKPSSWMKRQYDESDDTTSGSEEDDSHDKSRKVGSHQHNQPSDDAGLGMLFGGDGPAPHYRHRRRRQSRRYDDEDDEDDDYSDESPPRRRSVHRGHPGLYYERPRMEYSTPGPSYVHPAQFSNYASTPWTLPPNYSQLPFNGPPSHYGFNPAYGPNHPQMIPHNFPTASPMQDHPPQRAWTENSQPSATFPNQSQGSASSQPHFLYPGPGPGPMPGYTYLSANPIYYTYNPNVTQPSNIPNPGSRPQSTHPRQASDGSAGTVLVGSGAQAPFSNRAVSNQTHGSAVTQDSEGSRGATGPAVVVHIHQPPNTTSNIQSQRRISPSQQYAQGPGFVPSSGNNWNETHWDQNQGSFNDNVGIPTTGNIADPVYTHTEPENIAAPHIAEPKIFYSQENPPAEVGGGWEDNQNVLNAAQSNSWPTENAWGSQATAANPEVSKSQDQWPSDGTEHIQPTVVDDTADNNTGDQTWGISEAWGDSQPNGALNNSNSTGNNNQALDSNQQPEHLNPEMSFERSPPTKIPFVSPFQMPKALPDEPPLYTVPRSIAAQKAITHQVQPGSSNEYWRLFDNPIYKDSLDKPYARFVFKYRIPEAIEGRFGIKIDRNVDEEKRRWASLPKEELVEYLIRHNGLGERPPPPMPDYGYGTPQNTPMRVLPMTFLDLEDSPPIKIDSTFESLLGFPSANSDKSGTTFKEGSSWSAVNIPERGSQFALRSKGKEDTSTDQRNTASGTCTDHSTTDNIPGQTKTTGDNWESVQTTDMNVNTAPETSQGNTWADQQDIVNPSLESGFAQYRNASAGDSRSLAESGPLPTNNTSNAGVWQSYYPSTEVAQDSHGSGGEGTQSHHNIQPHEANQESTSDGTSGRNHDVYPWEADDASHPVDPDLANGNHQGSSSWDNTGQEATSNSWEAETHGAEQNDPWVPEPYGDSANAEW